MKNRIHLFVLEHLNIFQNLCNFTLKLDSCSFSLLLFFSISTKRFLQKTQVKIYLIDKM